ncbi:MAG: hypothetical protein KUG78_20275 [Kangiellaceae bacterium]|nr:hypothetical protein [Kangiellaceae bacterium]
MNSINHRFIFSTLILTSIAFFSVDKVFASSEAEFEVPFGLTMAPETRLVDVAQYYVGTIKEANGLLATKKTAKEVVSYYERALKAAGFRIFSKTDTPTRNYIAAKRGKGDFFSMSNTGDNSEVEPGETEIRFMIRYAN